MKRLALVLLSLLLLPAVSYSTTVQVPVAYGFDLDTPTETADDDQVVALTNLLASATYTIAAQPDVPRNITITCVDTGASITVGTVTVTGTDVNGSTITEVLDLSAALTLTGTKVFASVTSVVSAGVATLGGGGDETIKVGSGAVVAPIYCSFSGPHRSPCTAVTTGSSTTVTGLAACEAFAGVAVGDMIEVQGQIRYVASRTSASEVVVGPTALTLRATGVSFNYYTKVCGYGDTYGWVDTSNAFSGSIRFVLSADSLTADSGGKVSAFTDCRYKGVGIVRAQTIADALAAARLPGVWTAGTNGGTESGYAFIQTEMCPEARLGLSFNSAHSDDASDTGIERINAAIAYDVR